MKKYTLSYSVKGERKNRKKNAPLPNDAKKIKCNKRPRKYGKKYGVRIYYKYKGEKRNKVIPLPKDTKKVKLKK